MGANAAGRLSISNPADRRRAQRIHIQVPLFLKGVDAYGSEFVDLTKTLDISATGAYLASPRTFLNNALISLTIPAPTPSPVGAGPSGNAPIQARVRRQEAAGVVQLIGVEFLRPLE